MTKTPTPPPSRRNPLTPFYGVLALIAIAGAGILIYKTMNRGPAGASQPVDVMVTQEELQRVPGISRGRDDAPVVIYEFADYQCPHCADWAALVEPLVLERLIQPGLVRYVFYDFPLGGAFKHSFLAARAGRCANEQGKFWDYHGLIFARQSTWTTGRFCSVIASANSGRPMLTTFTSPGRRTGVAVSVAVITVLP